MRIVGQDHNGRIIIDGEGETINLTAQVPMPNSNFVVMTNFIFHGGNIVSNDHDHAQVMADIQEQLAMTASDPTYSPTMSNDIGMAIPNAEQEQAIVNEVVADQASVGMEHFPEMPDLPANVPEA